MAGAVQFPSPVHFVLKLNPPAVLKNISPEKAESMRGRINHAHDEAQQMLAAAKTYLSNAQGSWWLHPVTHLSLPAGGVAYILGTVAFNILKGEGYIDDSSYGNASSTTGDASCTTNGQFATLAGVLVTAVVSAAIYWGNNKQSAVAGTAADQAVHLGGITKHLHFLVRASEMSKECLKNNPPANLQLSFPPFIDHMKKKHKNVPHDLFAAWLEVDKILSAPAANPVAGGAPANAPAADPAAEGHAPANAPAANPPANDPLRDYIQNKVDPLIRDYGKQLIQQLIGLGYTPPAKVPEVVPHNGDALNG